MNKISFFSFKRVVLLFIINCAWVTFYSAFSYGLVKYVNLNWLLVLFVGWIVWYIWHSFFFDYIARIIQWLKMKNSYGLLIFGQVAPGVSFFATMMLLPLIYGLTEELPLTESLIFRLTSIFLIIAGLGLIIESFRTIGIGGAAFENDYSKIESALVTSSLYGVIRHPLFMGALIGSFGLSFAFGTLTCFGFPLISSLFSPLYKYIEESRLLNIYGYEYICYQKKVGAFIPKNISLNKIKLLQNK